ncbi:hypothetical protein ACFY97_03420 [Streptomyces klenkii]|uniref:hypothetical protein n=1 Tax=Streptomyces klenkii TaxID=1420899 RepID=UPI0036E521C3
MRVGADDLRECVVRLPRDAHGVGRLEVLHARCGQGQYRDVHALIVHVGQALLADIAQPARDRGVAEAELRDLRHSRLRPGIQQDRQYDVFLKAHDPR